MHSQKKAAQEMNYPVITLLTLASSSMLFADEIVLELDASISSQQILLGEPTVTWRYSASVTQGATLNTQFNSKFFFWDQLSQ